MSFNILVVEDEIIVRKFIIKALRASGLKILEIYEASTGKAGLEIIENNNIDFALIDLSTPDMNGEDLIYWLQTHPDTLKMPIVIISGESNQMKIEKFRKRGIGFIQKPFRPETLGETVINLISEFSN